MIATLKKILKYGAYIMIIVEVLEFAIKKLEGLVTEKAVDNG